MTHLPTSVSSLRRTFGITESERLINHFKNTLSRTSVHAVVINPMYYKSRIIDGQFQIRSEPRGEWRIVYNPVADVANAMAALSDDERMEVMACFCRSCGCIQPDGRGCQCWNDE